MQMLYTKHVVTRTLKTELCWLYVLLVVITVLVQDSWSLNGHHVCTVKQKYNVTKRVKFRAPMSVRTYEWCISIPPRCSKWTVEMRDLTRLETEERTAEMSVCCPGYKMKEVSCVPVCPYGKTGAGCSEDCASGKWGPNCVNECKKCSDHGTCSPITGECVCEDDWKGERCEISMPPPTIISLNDTTNVTLREIILTTTQSTVTHSPYAPTTLTTATESTRAMSTTETSTNVPRTVTVLSSSISASESPTKPLLTSRYNEEIINEIFDKQNVSESTSFKNNADVLISSTTMATSESPTAKIDTVDPLTALTTHIITDTSTPAYTKPETISKISQSTTKFKPKEIWIKPAQKGESSLIDSKIKLIHESQAPKSKGSTKKEISFDTSTSRTIIVSIIPTSIAYSTSKKLSLPTTPYQKESSSIQRINIGLSNFTPIGSRNFISNFTISTRKPLLTTALSPAETSKGNVLTSTVNPLLLRNITKPKSYKTFITKSTPTSIESTKFYSTTSNTQSLSTNSMTGSTSRYNTMQNASTYNSLTTIVATNVPRAHSQVHTTASLQISTDTKTLVTTTRPTKKPKAATSRTTEATVKTTQYPSVAKQSVTLIQNRNTTDKSVVATQSTLVKQPITARENANLPARKILTKLTTTNAPTHPSTTNSVTEGTTIAEDETFHILTEPEHITAVAGDRATEKSSMDLLSVLSIAGGVMMAVITVAVVIVMIERCRRPRYGEVRKVNDMRMKVVMDNTDVPPSYMRSIFHAPLPDPPTSEKSHYQPISTLDRNLKQFMRPVVVQTLSPVMLENFRGIIECHYDHLPLRNYNNGTMPARPVTAPSVNNNPELFPPRATSLTESTINSLKCEAKFDIIDSTTSEPLYAEIPCWRPPSEHAIEIVNLNGEAVTEL